MPYMNVYDAADEDEDEDEEDSDSKINIFLYVPFSCSFDFRCVEHMQLSSLCGVSEAARGVRGASGIRPRERRRAGENDID